MVLRRHAKNLPGDRRGDERRLHEVARFLRSPALTEPLNAHRVIDDCLALKAVLGNVATALGVRTRALLKPFAVVLDCATAAHIGMLAD